MTPAAKGAVQFNQGRAFARTGQAAEAGELVGTGEDVGQGLALVRAEVGRAVRNRRVMGVDRLDAGIDACESGKAPWPECPASENSEPTRTRLVVIGQFIL